MNRERFARLQELFHAATARPPDQRHAYLDEACSGDTALRDEALGLLDAWEAGPDHLVEDVLAAAAALEDDLPGDGRIGPYRIVRELGRGGMGVVYLAERDDEAFHKRVAIKVAPGPGGPQGARFVRERQILASLDHPGIARLLDGGTTPSGRPYLVMEHVEGEPIDEYCDHRRLTVEARLRLFVEVCRAVHFAHQSLVVHRDIKPENILVTASGEPRLLDFGIAKLLDRESPAPDPARTGTGVRPMTPEYASPEQIRGEPVTTASDIYSLGVVLYELLTGRRPFRLPDQPLVDIRGVISDLEPERPSVVVTREDGEASSGRTAPQLSSARRNDPRGLRRRLRGDLDNIVLMAMAKAPSDRYASAHQLAEDLRRHLEAEPVMARRPTWAYRTGRLIRRNRVAAASTAVAVALVLGFAANRASLASQLARERDRERRAAQTARHALVLLQDVLRAARPLSGDPIAPRELLDRALESARADLAGEPEAEATLLDTLGTIYGDMGVYERAVPLLEDALSVRIEAFGDGSPEAAASLESLANLQRQRGRYAEAVSLYQRALRIHEPRAPDRAAIDLMGLARTLQDGGHLDAARARALRAVELERGLGDGSQPLARALLRLGSIHRELGEVAEAARAVEEALAIRRRALDPRHPGVGVALAALASVRAESGDLDGAESAYRRALELLRPADVGDSEDVAVARLGLAGVLERRGELEAAEALAEAAGRPRRPGSDGGDRLDLEAAELLWRVRADDAPEAAEAGLRETLARRRQLLPPRHPDIAESLVDIGALLERRGREEEAEPLLRDAAAILREALPAGHWRIAWAESLLGGCLLASGHPDVAEPLLVRGEGVLESRRGPASVEAREAARLLARLYETSGRRERAAALRARVPG